MQRSFISKVNFAVCTFCASYFISLPCFSTDIYEWQLQNGFVKLSESLNCDSIKVAHPEFIGSGGGGSVFKVEIDAKGVQSTNGIMKVSWPNNKDSIANECQTLKHMANSGPVLNVETCLVECPLIQPDSTIRTMIVLTPFIPPEDSTSVFSSLSTDISLKASKSLISTMIQMLSTGITVSDIQFLVNVHTGAILLIDMTEAVSFSLSSMSDTDLLQIGGFIGETLSYIPNEFTSSTSMQQTVKDNITTLSSQGRPLPESILSILESYDLLLRD
eukprot:gene8422-17366_t